MPGYRKCAKREMKDVKRCRDFLHDPATVRSGRRQAVFEGSKFDSRTEASGCRCCLRSD